MKINSELIQLCLAGNKLAQKQLYTGLLPYLNVICQRYLNDSSQRNDVLQEAFINIFRSMNQFDSCKASFNTWASKITINCCLKNNQKFKKSKAEEFNLHLHETPVEPEIFKKFSNEAMLEWLKKMPEQYYQVFNLFVIDGFSHSEIAELLSIDTSLSRKRLERSREWLKKRLPEDFSRQFSFSYN